MRALLTLAIIGVPILDVASLVLVGRRIGVWPVVALVVAAGLAGSILVRAQGFALLNEARTAVREGRFPGRQVFDGACVLIGGALLIFPGFVSDILGLCLLTPPLRAGLRRVIGRMVSGSAEFAVWSGTAGQRGDTGGGRPPVIDGEYRNVANEEPEPPAGRDAADRPSPWVRKGPVVPSRDP